jgi:hypothetical protein
MRQGLSNILVGFGAALICLSLFCFLHQFTYSNDIFVLGGILVAAGFILSAGSKTINTNQINKNLKTLNNILWGKKDPEPAVIVKCPICGCIMEKEWKILDNYDRIKTRYVCPHCQFRTII